MKHVSHHFDVYINEDSYILILGSMPSIISRKKDFYYMNPNNRFYKILSIIYNDDFNNENIEIKKELLKKHHIALYDVISECDINNSSDQSIKNVIPTDISTIIKNYPIRKIVLNGKKAYELFLKFNNEYKDIAICLPSTSPANAKFNLDNLVKEWEVIKNI